MWRTKRMKRKLRHKDLWKMMAKEKLVKEKLVREMLVKEMLVMEGEGGGKVGKEVGICEKGMFLIDSLFLAANK